MSDACRQGKQKRSIIHTLLLTLHTLSRCLSLLLGATSPSSPSSPSSPLCPLHNLCLCPTVLPHPLSLFPFIFRSLLGTPFGPRPSLLASSPPLEGPGLLCSEGGGGCSGGGCFGGSLLVGGGGRCCHEVVQDGLCLEARRQVVLHTVI